MPNKIPKELEVKLTQDEWKKYNSLTTKQTCKKYKDAGEVFRFFLNAAASF